MEIRAGNGGWHRIDGVEGLPGRVYVRMADIDGHLRVTELYVDGRGEPLSVSGLRKLPLHLIEAWAVGDGGTRRRLGTPGVDLRRLATYYAHTFGTQAKHWIADSLRAQFPDSGVEQPPEARDTGSRLSAPAKVTLGLPPGGRITDAFLGDVRRAYEAAVLQGQSPAVTIAKEVGVSPKTVHAWVAKARDRGIMERAPRTGRIV